MRKISVWKKIVGMLLVLAAFMRPTTLSFADNEAQTSQEKAYRDPTLFEKAIAAFEEKDKQQPPAPGGVVFVGSSTIVGWKTINEDFAPLSTIARGFGGSNMNEALHYADRVVLAYSPRAVVVYEGDNDIAQGISPEKLRDTFKALKEKIHQKLPETRIYVLSIKPSVRRWTVWPQMKEANRLLAEECAQDKRLIFVDMASGMLDAEGQVKAELLQKDGLHLNQKGYKLWQDVLKPVLMQREMPFEKTLGKVETETQQTTPEKESCEESPEN